MVMRDSVPCRVPVLGFVAVGILALGVLPSLSLSQTASKPAKVEAPTQPAQPAPVTIEQQYRLIVDPAVAQTQEFVYFTQAAPAQGDERERKIKELEDKLQAILKEVKSLREAKGTGQPANKPKISQHAPVVSYPATSWAAVQPFNVEGNIATFYAADPVAKDQTITLSRASYKLPKEKAEALAAFLKHIKASVLETKVEDETVTVTTTPDVQHTIAQLVGLLTGKPHAAAAHWNYAVTPATAAPANAAPLPAHKAQPAEKNP